MIPTAFADISKVGENVFHIDIMKFDVKMSEQPLNLRINLILQHYVAC